MRGMGRRLGLFAGVVALVGATMVVAARPAGATIDQIAEYTLGVTSQQLCGSGNFGIGAGCDSQLAFGSDGNIWFAEPASHALAKMTPAGSATAYDLCGAGNTTGDVCLPVGAHVVSGGDGELYVSADLIGVGEGVARVKTDGTLDGTFTIAGGIPFSMTLGPDGKVWFGTLSTIGFVDPNAATPVTEFALPTAGSNVADMTAGPNGTVWFTEHANSAIGRIDATTHAITEYPYDGGNGQPAMITAAADGTLWFNDDTTLDGLDHSGQFAGMLWGIQGTGPSTGMVQPFYVDDSPLQPGDCPNITDLQLCRLETVAAPIVASDGHLYVSSEEAGFASNGALRRLSLPPAITSTSTGNIAVEAVLLPPSLATPDDSVVGPGGDLWYEAGRCDCGSPQDTLGNLVGVLDLTTATINAPPVAVDFCIGGVTLHKYPNGVAIDLSASASDPDGTTLNWELVTDPTSGSLTGSLPAVTFTVPWVHKGSATFTWRVNDGQVNSNVATATITSGGCGKPKRH